MIHVTISALTAMALALGFSADSEDTKPAPQKDAPSIYEFSMRDIDGEEVSLAKYRGQVCLIVNVASR